MEAFVKVIVLSIGGTLGVNARYWLGAWMSRWTSPQFPWATFTINVTGSFLIGFLTVVLTHWMPHPHFRIMVITGFLGGYTTFSTFENESFTLWERGEVIMMAANVIGSVVLGFAAVLVGTALARGLTEATSARAPTDVRGQETTAFERGDPLRPAGDAPGLEKIGHRDGSGGRSAHDDRSP